MPVEVMPRKRGARPSSPLARARAKWLGDVVNLQDVVPPANWWPGKLPQYSIASNSTFGDCVSAEEPNSKRAWSIAVGLPEIDIADSACVSFARSHGFLNGADLSEVMDAMAQYGMPDSSGVVHKDGAYHAVDYTNWTEVTQALYTYGTIKIACAANQLENVHTSKNGWVLWGASRDGAIDHCTAWHGFGTMKWLADQLGVALPSGVDPGANGVLYFTWGSIGIADFKSAVNISYQGEGWVRSPADLSSTTPNPPPPIGPVTPPTPIWPPVTGQLYVVPGATGNEIHGIVNFDGKWDYTMTPTAGASTYHLVPRVPL